MLLMKLEFHPNFLLMQKYFESHIIFSFKIDEMCDTEEEINNVSPKKATTNNNIFLGILGLQPL